MKHLIEFGGRAAGKTHRMKQHIQKMKGFKFDIETRVLIIDQDNNVWGKGVTQNQLFVKRLFAASRRRRNNFLIRYVNEDIIDNQMDQLKSIISQPFTYRTKYEFKDHNPSN